MSRRSFVGLIILIAVVAFASITMLNREGDIPVDIPLDSPTRISEPGTEVTEDAVTLKPSGTKEAVEIVVTTQSFQPTQTIIPSQTPSPTATSTPVLINMIISPVEGFRLDELRGIVYRGIVHLRPDRDIGHYGVDFLYYNFEDKGASILGVNVLASFPGKVISVVEWFPETELGFPFGNMVIIETPLSEIDPDLLAVVDPPDIGSLYVLYAHMLERPSVEMGDYVLAGQALGKVGNTGDSDAPHLHWEMRFGPSHAVFGYMTYYKTCATAAQMEAYERWRMSGEFVYFDPMLLAP